MSSNDDGSQSPVNTSSSSSNSNSNTNNDNTNNSNTNNSNTNNPNIDASGNYISNNDNITNFTLNQTISTNAFEITNQQGTTENDNFKTETNFDTIKDDTVDIDANLTEAIVKGYDDNSTTGLIISEIRDYATKIKCEEFHKKGSIDDYSALFSAASKIVNESKHMKLDVEIDGFNDFSAAADELSALFTSFTKKLQTVNIIDDTDFLRAVLNALKKIDNLSNIFGKFKNTILLTSTIRIPQSAHDTKVILEGVMGEINCAMNYINHFVNPDLSNNLPNAQLTSEDKSIINKAVETIDDWNVLCEQGVTIAMNNNTDIQYIKQTNSSLKTKTNTLRNATNVLRQKLANMVQ
jgi:hypothetical protein